MADDWGILKCVFRFSMIFRDNITLLVPLDRPVDLEDLSHTSVSLPGMRLPIHRMALSLSVYCIDSILLCCRVAPVSPRPSPPHVGGRQVSSPYDTLLGF